MGEPAIVVSRHALFSDIREFDAHGHADALPQHDGFAVAEQRQEVEKIERTIMRIGTHHLLVTLRGETHGNDSAALGENGSVEFRRALRNESQRKTVFTSFLRDSRECMTRRRETFAACRRCIAMSLFADKKHRQSALAPDREIEGKTRDNRDDDIENFRRHRRQVDNGDWPSIVRHTEQTAKDIGHRVLNLKTAEHEAVSLVAGQGFDAVLEAAEGKRLLRPVELAQLLVDIGQDIRQPERRRRIYRHAAIVARTARNLPVGRGVGVSPLGRDHRIAQNLDFRVVIGIAAR